MRLDVTLTYEALLELYRAAFRLRPPVPYFPPDVARAVWAVLWPADPWPKGWVVEWVHDSALPQEFFGGQTLGFCDRPRRRIELNYDALVMEPPERALLQSWLRNVPKCPLYTLVHELLHTRGFDHGTYQEHRAFDAMTGALVAKLWKEAS